MRNVYTGNLYGDVQTKYFSGPPQGTPGQLTFLEQNHIINGYPVQSEFIRCGRGVVRGSDSFIAPNHYVSTNFPFGIVVPTDASVAADFVGILTRDHGTRNDADGNAGKQIFDMAGILEEGFIFVKLYMDTIAKGPVYMVIDNDNEAGAPVGSFVSDVLDDAAILIPRLEWWASYIYSAQPYGIVRVYAK